MSYAVYEPAERNDGCCSEYLFEDISMELDDRTVTITYTTLDGIDGEVVYNMVGEPHQD